MSTSTPGEPGHSVSDDPTLGALVHDLTQQVPELIRSEIRLAQAEMTEKGKRAGLGIGMFSAAGLLAFFGLALRDRHRDPGAGPCPARLARGPDRRASSCSPAPASSALVGKKEVAAGDAARARAGDRGRQGGHRRGEGRAPMSDTGRPAELEAEIERAARRSSRETVDQLTHKLDVKAQAKERAAQVADRATTDDGKPRPELVAAAVASCCWSASSSGGADDDRQRPHPGSPGPRTGRPTPTTTRKPDSPTDLEQRSWFYVAAQDDGGSSATTSAPTSPPP